MTQICHRADAAPWGLERWLAPAPSMGRPVTAIRPESALCTEGSVLLPTGQGAVLSSLGPGLSV